MRESCECVISATGITTNAPWFELATDNELVRTFAYLLDQMGNWPSDRTEQAEGLRDIKRTLDHYHQSFEFDGGEYEYMDDTGREELIEQAMDDAVDMAMDEGPDLDTCYHGCYWRFDEDMFRRDLAHDGESLIDHYGEGIAEVDVKYVVDGKIVYSGDWMYLRRIG